MTSDSDDDNDSMVKGWADSPTAFPLNGKRLELLDIDHLFIQILTLYACEEIHNNPKHEKWQQLHRIFYVDPKDSKNIDPPIADLDRALQCWEDDFFNRMSQDRANADMKPLDEATEIEQLNKIIDYAKRHIIDKRSDRLT